MTGDGILKDEQTVADFLNFRGRSGREFLAVSRFRIFVIPTGRIIHETPKIIMSYRKLTTTSTFYILKINEFTVQCIYFLCYNSEK